MNQENNILLCGRHTEYACYFIVRISERPLPLPQSRSYAMPDLADGESVEVKGSAAKPYILKNTGGVYSCTCPAWRNQSIGIERRTCKHLKKLRGDAAESERIGAA